MKFIAVFLVGILISQAATQTFLQVEPREDVSKDEIFQIFKGVIKGLVLESQVNVDTIKQCITESKQTYDLLKKAIDDLNHNSLSYVKAGIQEIGQAIQGLPDAIQDCKAAGDQSIYIAGAIRKQLDQMKNPLTFAYLVGTNLLLNGVDILKETVAAVGDWQNSNYEDFGFQIGRILYQLLVKDVANMNATYNSFQTVLQIYQGVVLGFYEAGGIKIEDIQQCVFSTEGVVTDFIGAVQLLLTRDAKNVQEGLRLLGMGLQILPEAMYKCQSTVAEVTALADKMDAAIAQMQSPQTFAFHIGKDLLVNGRDIYQEISNAVVDWNNQNYAQFGQELGKAMYQLLVGVGIVE